MDRQRVYLGFRIGASVFFGILCVLLIALWAGSYSRSETLQGVIGTQGMRLNSQSGRVAAFVVPIKQPVSFSSTAWVYGNTHVDDPPLPVWFFQRMRPTGIVAVVPHWFLLLLTALIAAAPWINLNRQRIYLALRIATSVFFGLFTVLTIALWDQSYSQKGQVNLQFFHGPGFMIASEFGSLAVIHHPLRAGYVEEDAKAWNNPAEGMKAYYLYTSGKMSGFDFQLFPHGTYIASIPYWFPVLLTALLAVFPWVKWKWKWTPRFSLRTLLIAITLIALALGLIVAVSG